MPFRTQPPGAVLFDLDGTLVDSVPSLAAAVDRTLLSLGLDAAGEVRVRDWVGNGAAMLISRALAGNQEALPEPDPELHQQALDRFLGFYGEAPEVGTRLYEGVAPFVAALAERGLPMAIVTNKPARFVPALLKTFGLEGLIRLTVGGDTLPQRKPDPAPLLFAAARLGVSPERCLMVGDSASDVLAARSAGMAVACVSYGYNHGRPVSELRADWTVDSLIELL